MPLDAAQYQALIIAQVGDDAAGTLAAQIETLWTANDNQSSLATQALYTKRDAIDLLLGQARKGVDFTHPNGTKVELDQLFKHLVQMRQDVTNQIAAGAVTEGLTARPAVGQLTKTTPIGVDYAEQPDPSDRPYRGDPLRPGRRHL